MSYEVKITGGARQDMKTIYRYIADALMEPVIAEKQYSRIEKAIYSLDEMPERFRRYEKEPWRSRNLRIMPVDNYLVFYTVDNENLAAMVMRVMYGARNIEQELGDMTRQDDINPAALMIEVNEDSFEDVLTDIRIAKSERAIRQMQERGT